jgi:hypothetical protein
MKLLNLVFFWLKVFFKRTISFFRQSPVILLWFIILVIAFFIGRPNINLPSNTNLLVLFVIVLAVISLLVSFKNYNVLPALIAYSKSGLQNRHICFWFFVKQAFRNNLWLLIVDVIILYKLIKSEHFAVLRIMTVTVFSVILSFAIMYLKNKYNAAKIQKIAVKKSKISVQIKSGLYDYFSGDFLLVVVLGLALFAGIIVEFVKNKDLFNQIKDPAVIFAGSIIVLAILFLGIIDSIPKINWKFYAIIYPKNLSYHLKRTTLILLGSFCFLIVIFAIISSSFGIISLIKYLFCITMLLFFSIYNAFSLNNQIIKILRAVIFTILTIWVSALHPALLLTLIIPLLVTAILTKNDYKERYYL